MHHFCIKRSFWLMMLFCYCRVSKVSSYVQHRDILWSHSPLAYPSVRNVSPLKGVTSGVSTSTPTRPRKPTTTFDVQYHPERTATNPFGVFTIRAFQPSLSPMGKWFIEQADMTTSQKQKRVGEWCRTAERWGVLPPSLMSVRDQYQEECEKSNTSFNETCLNIKLLEEIETNIFQKEENDFRTRPSVTRLPRMIVIGDVHGCLLEMQELLRKCEYCIGDCIVFLGDLVGKGPHTLQVVQMAHELGALSVCGNHEAKVVLKAKTNKPGGHDVDLYESYAKDLGSELFTWLKHLPHYFSCKAFNSLFVHAGFVPGIDCHKQQPFLMNTMRSIDPERSLVTNKFLRGKGWGRLWEGPRVFFGHDARQGLQYHQNAIGLDTGCVYGGRLTACLLPNEQLVSVKAQKPYLSVSASRR